MKYFSRWLPGQVCSNVCSGNTDFKRSR